LVYGTNPQLAEFLSRPGEFAELKANRNTIVQGEKQKASIGSLDTLDATLIDAIEGAVSYYLLAAVYVNMFLSNNKYALVDGLAGLLYERVGDLLSSWLVGD